MKFHHDKHHRVIFCVGFVLFVLIQLIDQIIHHINKLITTTLLIIGVSVIEFAFSHLGNGVDYLRYSYFSISIIGASGSSDKGVAKMMSIIMPRKKLRHKAL